MPTVVVCARAMVNPGVEQVRAALAGFAPELDTPAPRAPAIMVLRGLVGPLLVLAVWAVVIVITPDTVFHLGPALLAASWAVAARADAARALGFGLGGVLAAGGAAISTAALLALSVLGAAGPSVTEAVFAVAGGAAVGVVVAGRRKHRARSG